MAMGEMDKRMHIICVYPNKLAAVMNTVNKMNDLVCPPQRDALWLCLEGEPASR